MQILIIKMVNYPGNNYGRFWHTHFFSSFLMIKLCNSQTLTKICYLNQTMFINSQGSLIYFLCICLKFLNPLTFVLARGEWVLEMNYGNINSYVFIDCNTRKAALHQQFKLLFYWLILLYRHTLVLFIIFINI